MDERQAGVISRGKLSSIALETLGPELRDAEARIVQQMKHLYRTGDYNETQLAACVAQLVLIESIETSLKTKIKRAGEVLKETLNGQP